MDRAEMINSLAEAMGLKPAVTDNKELSKKYNTSTGTIYCNKTNSNDTQDQLLSKVSVFPVKRLAM